MKDFLINALGIVMGLTFAVIPILVHIANERQREWEVRFNHEQEERKRQELEDIIVKRVKVEMNRES